MNLRDYMAELRRRTDLESILAKDMPVEPAGGVAKALCPFHNERTPSFIIYAEDEHPHCHCFGCGWHGDAVKFIMEFHRLSFRRAVEDLAAYANMQPYPWGDEATPGGYRQAEAIAKTPTLAASRVRDQARDRRDDFMARLALKIWRRGGPANGTAAEVYMKAARAIDCAAIGGVPPSLRFCAALPLSFDPREAEHLQTHPAIIGGIQDPDGKLAGVHVTYLAPDCRDRYRGDYLPGGRRMIGQFKHCAIRLGPAAPTLGISEGWENGLIAQTRRAAEGKPLTCWAALSIGNIAGGGDRQKQRKAKWHPTAERADPKTGELSRRRLPTEHPDMQRPGLILPDLCRKVIILGDADSDPFDTEAQYRRATRRWQKDGRKVAIAWPPAGTDFTNLGGGL